MVIPSCCGKTLRRLGRIGRKAWFQCLKCSVIYTLVKGAKQVLRQKGKEC